MNSCRQLQPAQPYRQVFTAFFQEHTRAGSESVSGHGSSCSQTKEIRRVLPELLTQLGVHTLLDAPCGDFNWMQHLLLGIEKYIGVDIVPEVIERNKNKHARNGRDFVLANIATDKLPSSDLILCRDFLVHLPHREVLRALSNFKKNGAQYLLMTTFTGNRDNPDIALGEWRPINFCKPPFNLPLPQRVINEQCTENGGIYADKSLGLWSLNNL